MFPLEASGQPGQDNQKKGDPLGAMYWVFNVHASCITPFIRKGFGSEALGFPGLFALGTLVFCTAVDPHMLIWLGLWLVAVIVQRIITIRTRLKGAIIHSRWNGHPWLAMKFPFVKREETAMQFIEPMMCFAFGALLMAWSQFMGMFLMAGFISLLGRGGIEQEIFNRRLTRMRDAEIEASYYANRRR